MMLSLKRVVKGNKKIREFVEHGEKHLAHKGITKAS
jgi:hypothetical protein